ncbi:VOC family protein [Halobacillus locisalis]|uniref:VOC family protein n=1 Tax=Halobacillus locisalis TaxID=220753 RepID=A0A838CRY5_9BACI|nr:VOC family protein [Halobacillus locisalis]MBA2174892.1 VOC family protein [Halobacillus locisalis]
MIERIDTMCLKVSDVEKSSQWYQEILGFEVAFQNKGYRVLKVGSGGIPLTIEEGVTTTGSSQNYPIFFARDIEGTYEKLVSEGVKVDPLQNDGVNHFFDFYDLDGNKLQVCFFES